MRKRYNYLKTPPDHPNPPRCKHKEILGYTIDDWNRIVEVYRKHDCRISFVATALGWPEARTRRCFNQGYPSLGLPSIRTILAKDALAAEDIRAGRQTLEEAVEKVVPKKKVHTVREVVDNAQLLAEGEAKRIKAMVDAEEDRQRARRDAIESRAEEALLVSVNRRNALALNGVTAKMLKGAMALSERIQTELEAEANSDRLSVAQKLSLVRSAASIARFNSEASMLAIKAERMVLGTPIDAPEEKYGEEAGSLADTERWLQVTIRAITKAKERGVLTAEGTTVSEGTVHAGKV